MVEPNFVILYVESARESAAFYAELLGRGPVESSANFAMFALSSGVMLGLWTRRDVKPAASAAGGGELAITVGDDAAVGALHEEWRGRKLRIAQEPTEMDFGFTFVALDPDGTACASSLRRYHEKERGAEPVRLGAPAASQRPRSLSPG